MPRLLIAVVGLPLSGKSTIARVLSETLEIRHLDIDDNIRMPIFGKPHPNPETSDELRKRDGAEMKASYDMFFGAMDIYLRNEWPLIVTATFSSKKFGQDRLASVVGNYPDAVLKVIWCKVERNPELIIQNRLLKREFGVNYFGATNSYERWKVLADRYEPIELPHVVIDTASFLKTASVARALAHIDYYGL